MTSWVELAVAVAFASLAASLVVWRLKVELSAGGFAATTLFLGFAVSIGYIGLVVIKGVSPTAFLFVVGLAYATLMIATLGHPGVLYHEWLGEGSLSRRQTIFLYVRLIIAALLVALLTTPLLQSIGYR